MNLAEWKRNHGLVSAPFFQEQAKKSGGRSSVRGDSSGMGSLDSLEPVLILCLLCKFSAEVILHSFSHPHDLDLFSHFIQTTCVLALLSVHDKCRESFFRLCLPPTSLVKYETARAGEETTAVYSHLSHTSFFFMSRQWAENQGSERRTNQSQQKLPVPDNGEEMGEVSLDLLHSLSEEPAVGSHANVCHPVDGHQRLHQPT